MLAWKLDLNPHPEPRKVRHPRQTSARHGRRPLQKAVALTLATAVKL
jgi:hypothetical protein